MSADPERIASQCAGKHKFPSYAAARRNGLPSLRRRDTRVQVYRCEVCRCFHIGGVRREATVRPARPPRDEDFRYEGEYDRRKR